MNEPIQKPSTTVLIENLFLKIFKVVILLVMSLTLLAVVIFGAVSIYKYAQSPKEPAPAAPAPKQEVNLDKLLNELTPKEPPKEEPKQPAPKDDEPQQKVITLRYNEETTRLYRCSVDFAKSVGKNIEESDAESASKQIETYRVDIERVADAKPDRGDAYVKDSERFVCAALHSPKLVALYKEKNLSGVFIKTLNFHIKEWDRISREVREQVAKEEARVERERMAEELRVAAAKRDAALYIMIAGGAFGVFMLLALYLLFSKIENNLRHLEVLRKPQA